LSNDRLKNEGLEPTLSNDRLKNDGLESILSNDRLKIREGTDIVDSSSNFPMISVQLCFGRMSMHCLRIFALTNVEF
jgi:hypothetical protein